jgi:hypothetical protein
VPAHVRQVRTGKAIRFNVIAAGDRQTRTVWDRPGPTWLKSE